MSDNSSNGKGRGNEDVSRLFARLGTSHNASGYKEFAPVALPAAASPHQVAAVAPWAPPAVSDAVVQSNPPRLAGTAAAVPAPVESPVEPASPGNDVVQPTALQQLFQRLLQADAPLPPRGPLTRLFPR